MLPVLQIVFILITSCKVQDYVDIIGRSKCKGTLAFRPSQDAAHTSRLVLLTAFCLSFNYSSALCCKATRHFSLAGHILLDWLLPCGIIKNKYNKRRNYIGHVHSI